MKYLVTAQEMKQYDKNTIEYLGIPGPVLMERAALAAEDFLKERFDAVKERTKVLIFAGMGNNGGDGLALARLLASDGYDVAVRLVGNPEKATEQWNGQWQILQHFPVKTDSNADINEYNVIVDAVFGVGLSRPVEGIYAKTVEQMNEAEGFKLALDVPSGICSDTGEILGCAFRADATVTFGFCKRGLVLYPGAEYAGQIRTARVGIGPESFLEQIPEMFTYEKGELCLPKRNPAGNKGTFGKALLVAGSNGMAGAAVLAAKAAYRTGTGMVKVITAEENRQIIQQGIPEALYGSYRQLSESLEWADVIAIGPGIGREEQAMQCLKTVIEKSRKPLILDADALNLLAEKGGENLAEQLRSQGAEGRIILLTPHVGELSRLLKRTIPECKQNFLTCARMLAEHFHAVAVAKDARTVVCREQGAYYLNITGNSGMATAGSGDVLTGVILGFLAQGADAFPAATYGVYFHGMAGELAAKQHTEYGVMAGDIADCLMKDYNEICSGIKIRQESVTK